jgi:hypothetical protein
LRQALPLKDARALRAIDAPTSTSAASIAARQALLRASRPIGVLGHPMPLPKTSFHQTLKVPKPLQVGRGCILQCLLSIMQDGKTQQECRQLMA